MAVRGLRVGVTCPLRLNAPTLIVLPTATSPALTRRGRPAEEAMSASLYRLSVAALWRAVLASSPAFWFISLYVFFEYVRPQTIYKWMDVLPWSLTCLLGATVFTIVEGRASFRASGLWATVGLFTAVIVASGFAAQYPGESWLWKDLWINWLLLMFVIGAGVRTRKEMTLLLVGFTLWNLKMTQHGVRSWAGAGFAFRDWGITGAPGWFQNSGEFGIELCIFGPIVGFFAYGLWPQLSKGRRLFAAAVMASVVISIVGSSSRGAIVGAGLVCVWLMLRSPKRLQATLIVVSMAVVVWVILPAESKQRFTEAGEDQTSQSRLTYWGHAIEIGNQYPMLGIGYKNWIPYYRSRYNPRGELPHNYFMEAFAELGYSGAIALSLIIAAFFFTNSRTRRITKPTSSRPDRLLFSLALGFDGGMIGFLGSGAFVSVLWYPFIWMNVALCLALYRIASDQSRGATVGGGPLPGRGRRLVTSSGPL
jgi:putative inorganic carbon (HCO3(-)) transporter